MPRLRLRPGRLLLLLLLLLIGMLAWSFAPVRLTAAPENAWRFEPLRAQPPAELGLSVIQTGYIESRHGFSVRGASLAEEFRSNMVAVLVDHPKGRFLIDTGLGRDVAAQVEKTPWLMRTLSKLHAGRPAADQLAEQPGSRPIDGILLTHAHWDHVSAIPDFPGVAIHLPQVERNFIAQGTVETELVRSFGDLPWHEYSFDGGPYLGYETSHDLFGDGSVVIVPSPGHTPGSVVVFVNLPSGRHFAFIGDLAWTLEGVEWPAERPLLARMLVDRDPDAVREGLRHVHWLMQRMPDLTVVPAHDARAHAKLPTFPAVVN